MAENNHSGQLIVNVTTARGAIPLEDVSVTVFSEAAPGVGGIVTAARTGPDGKTARLTLPAPDRSLSLSPGGEKPFATYTIQAEKEGFYVVTDTGVPVFADVTSIQPVDMLALAEYDSVNVYPRTGTDFTESENPDL